MKKLIAILLIVSSCSSRVESSKEASERITYFKDERAGLCFAQIESYSHGGHYITSITEVPCEKVKSLLIK